MIDPANQVPEGQTTEHVTDNCQHGADEDHMFCVVCGECREDLDTTDTCIDCGGVVDDER